MKLDLLTTGIEIGLVTTNLDAMVYVADPVGNHLELFGAL